jgi:hypothetical protein
MKDQPAAVTTGSPPAAWQASARASRSGAARVPGQGPSLGAAERSMRCRAIISGAVVHLGHTGHDARGAERQQRAGQAEQFVGASRDEQPGLAARQDEAERRAAQPLEVVHGHRAVVKPQRGEHRAVGAEGPVRDDVRQPGAVDRREHPRRGRGPPG